MAALALAAVALQYMSSMSASSKAAAAAAEAYGIKTSNIDAQARIKTDTAARNLVAIEASRIEQSIQVDQQGALAEAQARVAAATTGTTGMSVDQTIQQTDTNELRAKHQVDTIAKRAKQKVYNDIVDLGVSSEMSKGVFTNAPKAGLLQHAATGLSLLSAFNAGGGFDKGTGTVSRMQDNLSRTA